MLLHTKSGKSSIFHFSMWTVINLNCPLAVVEFCISNQVISTTTVSICSRGNLKIPIC